MIRIAIFADTFRRARAVRDLLSEDERFEIVEVRAWSDILRHRPPAMADVVLAAFIPAPESWAEGPPIVALGFERAEIDASGSLVRAALPGDATPAELSAAVVAVAAGLVVLTREQAGNRLAASRSAPLLSAPRPESPDAAWLEPLTTREQEVLRMMVDGLANKEIAARLRIPEHTAKFHVSQILAKLGAATRAEAVAIAFRRGLAPL